MILRQIGSQSVELADRAPNYLTKRQNCCRASNWLTPHGLGKCEFQLALWADDGYLLEWVDVRLHVLRPL